MAGTSKYCHIRKDKLKNVMTRYKYKCEVLRSDPNSEMCSGVARGGQEGARAPSATWGRAEMTFEK